MGKSGRKLKIFQDFLHNGKQKEKNICKKQYIHRIFVINAKAVLVQLAECRKAFGFTTRGSNSPKFLAGRM